MSELVSIYRRYLSECNAHRFDGLSAFVHPSLQVNGREISLADYAGRLAALVETLPDFRWELVDVVASDEKLAVRIQSTGTPLAEWMGVPPNGKSVSVTELVFYTFRGDKIAEIWVLFDVLALQAQLK